MWWVLKAALSHDLPPIFPSFLVMSLSVLGYVPKGAQVGLTGLFIFLFLVICFIVLLALTCFTWIWGPSLCPKHLLWPVLFMLLGLWAFPSSLLGSSSLISTLASVRLVAFRNACFWLGFVGIWGTKERLWERTCVRTNQGSPRVPVSHAAGISLPVRSLGLTLKLAYSLLEFHLSNYKTLKNEMQSRHFWREAAVPAVVAAVSWVWPGFTASPALLLLTSTAGFQGCGSGNVQPAPDSEHGLLAPACLLCS